MVSQGFNVGSLYPSRRNMLAKFVKRMTEEQIAMREISGRDLLVCSVMWDILNEYLNTDKCHIISIGIACVQNVTLQDKGYILQHCDREVINTCCTVDFNSLSKDDIKII